MPITTNSDNFLPSAELTGEPYARQMTSYRRTQRAILEATKDVITRNGLRSASMIEIADSAQVSRATLYNHYRDKQSVLRGVLEDEVERLFSAPPSLAWISTQISTHSALATMRRTDPGVLATVASSLSDPAWSSARQGLARLSLSPGGVELALRWLLGQIFAPLSPDESAQQAQVILR